MKIEPLVESRRLFELGSCPLSFDLCVFNSPKQLNKLKAVCEVVV